MGSSASTAGVAMEVHLALGEGGGVLKPSMASTAAAAGEPAVRVRPPVGEGGGAAQHGAARRAAAGHLARLLWCTSTLHSTEANCCVASGEGKASCRAGPHSTSARPSSTLTCTQ